MLLWPATHWLQETHSSSGRKSLSIRLSFIPVSPSPSHGELRLDSLTQHEISRATETRKEYPRNSCVTPLPCDWETEQDLRLLGPAQEDLLKPYLLLPTTIRCVADTQCLGKYHSQLPNVSSCLKELTPMCPLCQDCPQGSRPCLLAIQIRLSQMVLSWVLLSNILDSPSQEAVSSD